MHMHAHILPLASFTRLGPTNFMLAEPISSAHEICESFL
jgi:hypothetical protein